jgi:outer membrane protein OmpA-like peptidoglycan-associated protein
METGFNNNSNQQILSELRYLNQRINNLSSNSNALPYSNRENSTIIMPGSTTSNPVYPLSDGNTTTIIPSNNKKIEELQDKIDSLKNVEVSSKNENYLMDSLNTMKVRLKDVRREMANLESKMIANEKLVTTEESTENRSYFKAQVYFDNNSETLRADYFPYIQDLTQILIQYPEAKIMLEGWASPLGKETYNKQLSMRRADAVKQAFVNNRIEASRIISSFKGEDQSSSEQHARRVDMSIIMR